MITTELINEIQNAIITLYVFNLFWFGLVIFSDKRNYDRLKKDLTKEIYKAFNKYKN